MTNASDAVIRVASVPSAHPYVAHLSSTDDDVRRTVVRLPDPPVTADDGTTRWWPPRMLDAAWLREHADEFDVLHVHFGFESFSQSHLAGVVQTVHHLGKAFVATVHDLRNPHVADGASYLEQLGELVDGADELITLTPGAAEEIYTRWGRRATVIPHPHIVDLSELTDAEAPLPRAVPFDASRPARVSVHLKDLRANVDAEGALHALAALPDWARGVVTIHPGPMNPDDRGYSPSVAGLIKHLSATHAIDLLVHEPMSDAELYNHLRSCDVSVLPYVWGTHSGWIEMCHDLGVRVVAPDIGFYAEQHHPTTYQLGADAGGEARIEPHDLAVAITASLSTPPPMPASIHERVLEREAVARGHRQVYERALAAAR